jgi:hypothetical protein
MPLPVTIAVEGSSDVPIVRRVLQHVGCSIAFIQGRGGKSVIDKNLVGYNNAAKSAPWLVIRDLDHDADCAPELAEELLPGPSEWMRFRIVVREIESWILADAGTVANFLRVKRTLIPNDPDGLEDPKGVLLDLARRSPNTLIKADMVQGAGLSAEEGPAYVSRIKELASVWSPHVAMTRSDSLRRCIKSLKTLKEFAE